MMIDIVPSFIQQYPTPLPKGQGQVKIMDIEIFNDYVLIFSKLYDEFCSYLVWW